MMDTLTGITAVAIYARKSNEQQAARRWTKTQEPTSN